MVWGHNQTQTDTNRHKWTQPDTTGYNQTQPDTTGHNRTKPDKTRHNQTQQDTTRHNKTQQDTTRHNQTQPDTTKPKYQSPLAGLYKKDFTCRLLVFPKGLVSFCFSVECICFLNPRKEGKKGGIKNQAQAMDVRWEYRMFFMIFLCNIHVL